ncbi:hypothetical protein SCHPADRAFT_282676 [Schizopora paradoxa]|uniref:TPR-like protein n=1 Tax=Schizopora paradoxa TaxID=27342 RepID=A0A0H2RSR2_9AGAM|nr:hypothetical protein SCHPADRAFT_282676 [Schizopora paradoxa]
MKLGQRALSLLHALINETTGDKAVVTPQLLQNIAVLSQSLTNILEYVRHQQKHRNLLQRIWDAKSDAATIGDLNSQIDDLLALFNLKSNMAIQKKLDEIKDALEDQGHGVQSTAGSPGLQVLPPPPSMFFGRQQIAEELISMLLASEGGEGARVAVLGAGGIGKTTLSLFALHDGLVGKRFGTQRYFVRCDAVNSADGLWSAIAISMGISGGNLQNRISSVLNDSTHPSLLVLDNFETPWEPAISRESVEDVLKHLAAIEKLSLILTLRGSERPLGPKWTRPFLPPLQPLDQDSAHSLFRALSDADDADVAGLLRNLDNVPLAITLMANLAQYEGTKALLKRWEKERVGMLTRGPKSRLSSMEVSIQVSIDCPRMRDEPEALALLKVVSLLPDGVEDDTELDAIVSYFKSSSRAASTLKQVALAYSSDTTYLAVLAPVREFVSRSLAPPPLLHLRSLAEYYLHLAHRSAQLESGVDGVAIIQLLTSKVGNMQACFTTLLSNAEFCQDVEMMKRMIKACIETTDLYRYTGLGDTSPLEAAAKAAHTAGMVDLEGQCLLKLGELLYARSRQDAATAPFQQALQKFVDSGDLGGQSRCHLMLGMLKSQAGNYSQDNALNALDLARRGNDKIAEADCLLRLAQSAAWRDEYVEARQQVDIALETYTKAGLVRAQARCQWLQGFVEYGSRGDYATTIKFLDSALHKYRSVGDPTGEANCLRIMGRVSISRFECVEADRYLFEAIRLYSSVQWTYGLADCHQARGENAALRYDDDGAEVAFKEAQKFYEEINHKPGQVFCHRSLGAIALRQQNLSAAREHFIAANSLSTSVADKARHRYDMACLQAIEEPSKLEAVITECTDIISIFGSLPSDAGLCLQLQGASLMSLKREEEAVKKFKDAIECFRVSLDARYAGGCYVHLAELASRSGNAESSKAYYQQAKEQFELGHDTRRLVELANAGSL